MRSSQRRKRIVRTFNFNRILVFTVLVCFAVALLATVFSIKRGKKYVTVNVRTFYAVTFAETSSRDEAQSLAENCAALGGGGYVLSGQDAYFVIASVYSGSDEASGVSSGLKDGGYDSRVIDLVFSEIRIDESGTSALTAEILAFAAHTLPDALMNAAIELDSGETTESVTLKRLDAFEAEAARLSEKIAPLNDKADSSVAAARELLDTVRSELSAARGGEGLTVSRVRYALASVVAEMSSVAVRLSAGAPDSTVG